MKKEDGDSTQIQLKDEQGKIKRIDCTRIDITSRLVCYNSFTVELRLFILHDTESASAKPSDAGEKTAEKAKDTITVSHIEDNQASDTGGEWVYIIPASLLAGLLGYALTRGRKKKGQGNENPQPPELQEMHVYKNFGDSLVVGDNMQAVYACIIRKPRNGLEYIDRELTAIITASGDNYLSVQDCGMQGDWHAAWVRAVSSPPPPGPEAPAPMGDGVVTFSLSKGGAAYTNRLHFKVIPCQILFHQDNITIPAHYTKEVRLPFFVMGMDHDAMVSAVVRDREGKPAPYYQVRAEWSVERNQHEVVITDKMLDENADYHTPGQFLEFELQIEAKNAAGLSVKTYFPLFRFYMGLTLELGDVGCYIEEYDHTRHHHIVVSMERNGKTYVPAQTHGYLKYYDYDEAENRIVVTAPELKKCTVKAIDPADEQMVEGIGLNGFPVGANNVYGTDCMFLCTKGKLLVPSRIEAVVTVKAKHNGREYTCERQVLLCSQPKRQLSNEEWLVAWKEDERILKQIDHLKYVIRDLGVGERLLPLYKYMDILEKSYLSDKSYGIDRSSALLVSRVLAVMLNEAADYTFDERIEPLSFAEECFEAYVMTAQQVVHAANTVNKYLAPVMLLVRLAAGFISFGQSEASGAATVIFHTYDLASAGLLAINLTETYIEQGVEGLGKELKVLAVDTLKWQVFMMGMRLNLYVAKMPVGQPGTTGITRAKTTAPQPRTPAKASGKQFSGAKKGRITKQALQENKQRQAQAKEKVKVNSKNNQSSQLPKDQTSTRPNNQYPKQPNRDLNPAEQFGKARAKQNVNDLRAACDEYRANPTKENLLRRNEMIRKCQADKETMYLLKDKGEEFNLTRRDFNDYLHGKDGVYAKTDAAVERELSKKLGGRKVRHKNISSKDPKKLQNGEDITLDRDTTYEYYDEVEHRWKTIDDNTFGVGTEKMVEKIYNRNFQEATGIKQADGKKLVEVKEEGGDVEKYQQMEQNLADKNAKRLDQTVIQNEDTNPDSYGKDVGRILNPKRHGEKLDNPQQVGKAVEHKGTEWFKRGDEMIEEADFIKEPLAKVAKQADGIGNMREGARQETKTFDAFTESMDSAQKEYNGGSMISDDLRMGIEIFRFFHEGTFTLEQTLANLRNIGFNSLYDVAIEHGRTVASIGS
ncbi:MAG: hypothetical protein IKX36_08295 [Prevotella sp.]|nr:hypothetical protein [Prevotella sp.]